MSPPILHFDVTDQVATLTLDSPHNRNALGADMRVALSEAVHTVRHDRSIRALVITGAGGQFCSGGDLRNMAEVKLDSQGWRERMHDLQHIVRDLITLDRPVIAAVDGAAYGAGFGLALTADFVIATPRALLHELHAGGSCARLRRPLHPAAHRRHATREGTDAVGSRGRRR